MRHVDGVSKARLNDDKSFVLVEGKKAAFAGCRVSRMCASERGRGVFDIAVIGRCSLLLLDKFLEFDAIVRPDAVGEIVEELEDSERLFGCPFGIEGGCQQPVFQQGIS